MALSSVVDYGVTKASDSRAESARGRQFSHALAFTHVIDGIDAVSTGSRFQMMLVTAHYFVVTNQD